MTLRIAFVLFPQFEELDFVGPYEVFGMASKYVDQSWSVFTVGEEPVVIGFLGAKINVDHTFADAPPPDIIVVPGGFGTRPGVKNEALVGYIRRAGASAQFVTSVCTGAMLLHAAGFLAGKRAATHWGARKELADMGNVTVVEDQRWVHEGNVITAAGVSAGIDMALYLVGQLKSPEAARQVQRFMEYDPSPPYAEVPAPV